MVSLAAAAVAHASAADALAIMMSRRMAPKLLASGSPRETGEALPPRGRRNRNRAKSGFPTLIRQNDDDMHFVGKFLQNASASADLAARPDDAADHFDVRRIAFGPGWIGRIVARDGKLPRPWMYRDPLDRQRVVAPKHIDPVLKNRTLN